MYQVVSKLFVKKLFEKVCKVHRVAAVPESLCKNILDQFFKTVSTAFVVLKAKSSICMF